MEENKIKMKVQVNTDELEEMADTMERIGDAMPDIVVRNNQNVYFTVNNFVEKQDNNFESEED